MIIMKSLFGERTLYNTDAPELSERTDQPLPELRDALQHHIRETIDSFLRKHYPEKHEIFYQFGDSYFYATIKAFRVAALREPSAGFLTDDDILWSCVVEAYSEEAAIESAYEIVPMHIAEVYELKIVTG